MLQAANIRALENKLKIMEDMGKAADMTFDMHESRSETFAGSAASLRAMAKSAKNRQEKDKMNKDANNREKTAAHHATLAEEAKKAAADAWAEAKATKKMIAQLKVCSSDCCI